MAGYRVLDPEGNLLDGAHPRLSLEETVEGLRWMLLSRAVDARATAMHRQGRFGTYSPVRGQEASVVGSAMALDPSVDWIVPSYRELPALVRHGMPLERVLAGYLGKGKAARIPDEVRLLPNQVALATQLQHAVGLAWGLALQRRPGVVMAYCGEGASSEGDFHEACNLAGVKRAPVIFVLINNQWAISTPRSAQSAGELHRRAEGYGFPGLQVDGNDLLAVYEVAEEAVRRARAGQGPTLIECLTHRQSFHNTTDNPRRYLPEGWLEQAEREDPIRRIEAYLAAQGMWDDATRAAVEAEVIEQVEEALEAALAMPAACPTDLFDDVYADPPQRVRRQREELLGRTED
ncbi:MAG TPA: thiamine pyrophosphate-dependent dehydrogenase E1 component subunit alpha [Candidatus Dormibacteraeota bacterium]|nr:thiamine pyrophosphate-dependent dehydrogenase E1 component subunit alpha [Candidatus Dormibacteraeota bacterium]